MKIDGKEIASAINQKLTAEVSKLKKQNIIPHLAIILVGNDPASKSYVRQKEIKTKEIGGLVSIYHYPATVSEKQILDQLNNLNYLTEIHGIIVQRPLPQQINEEKISEGVAPEKDIDAFHPQTKFSMPLACAVLKILEEVFNLENSHFNIVSSFDILYSNFLSWLKSKKITVMGKGRTGGGPIIEMFRKMKINPQIIDSKTTNCEPLTESADIIISTVGKPHLIKPEMIKKGVILIGVGLHKEIDGKLHGDFEEEKINNIASYYTPTPGGVGPVNVACLLKNLVASAKK